MDKYGTVFNKDLYSGIYETKYKLWFWHWSKFIKMIRKHPDLILSMSDGRFIRIFTVKGDPAKMIAMRQEWLYLV